MVLKEHSNEKNGWDYFEPLTPLVVCEGWEVWESEVWESEKATDSPFQENLQMQEDTDFFPM